MKIIVISCDKNIDLFKPFFHCMEKYWPNHPEIIYSTESVTNIYYKTISINYDIEHWTDRVRETVKQIDDDYVLFMVDDIFIREKVDNEKVLSLCDYLIGDYANINLQLNGDKKATFISDELLERSSGKWNLCCMCTLWQKNALLDLFDYSANPWAFEENNYIKDYKFLISKSGDIINWGRKSNKEWSWGIMQGKWVPECIKFFIKEGIDKDIDFSKRGIWYPKADYHFMQLAGDCSGIGYLGNNRLKGPVDNVITKGAKCIKALLDNTYYEQITTETPTTYPHKKWYENDSDITYDYDLVQIVHNNPSDIEYQVELKTRCILLSDFYKNILAKNNFYFTINFNNLDLTIDNEDKNNSIENTIKTLQEYNILDRVIFVGLRATKGSYSNRHPINIDYYKKTYSIKYVEITNNDVCNPSEIDRCHKQFLTQFKENIKMKKCFGIISYFTWDQPERKQRQDRLDRLVKRLSDLWPDIPIMIIAQQWKYYKLDGKCKNPVIRFDYEKLGILGARHALRKHFLESDFDYLIMLDDDALFELDTDNVAQEYMDEIDKHPEGFCFLQYYNSQLNLCAISKYIYLLEPIPNIDAQKSEGFEDRVWSALLHYKYPDKEFTAPKGIRCIHFKNPVEVVPSTWASQQKYNWKQMRENTVEIVEYIAENKELPEKWKK